MLFCIIGVCLTRGWTNLLSQRWCWRPGLFVHKAGARLAIATLHDLACKSTVPLLQPRLRNIPSKGLASQHIWRQGQGYYWASLSTSWNSPGPPFHSAFGCIKIAGNVVRKNPWITTLNGSTYPDNQEVRATEAAAGHMRGCLRAHFRRQRT